MKCPVCTDIPLAMTTRQEIEIDYCPNCRGVWLDRGELDRLIERSEGPGSAQHRDRDRLMERPGHAHRGERPYKRPKSLLGELFDF